ncbi:hypothetical protein Tco_1140642, partial [Tanacetum coccineum]
MEPGIENMTIPEYLEYEGAKERRLWDDFRSRRSPTNYNEADVDSFHRNKRFPAQSVGSSNTDVLDLPCLLVLITGTSQSRQHVDTSLIHIESRKSPTKSLFDAGSSRISIFI